jgi:hypothetical protein
MLSSPWPYVYRNGLPLTFSSVFFTRLFCHQQSGFLRIRLSPSRFSTLPSFLLDNLSLLDLPFFFTDTQNPLEFFLAVSQEPPFGVVTELRENSLGRWFWSQGLTFPPFGVGYNGSGGFLPCRPWLPKGPRNPLRGETDWRGSIWFARRPMI